MKSKLLKGYFVAKQDGMARCYLVGVGLSLKIKNLVDGRFKVRIYNNDWAHFYYKRQAVWDCNKEFFREHFRKLTRDEI